MKPLIVPGHGLQAEGRPYNERGERIFGFTPGSGVLGASPIREGRGLCACGEMSEVLSSNADRQRWHRAHKALVLANRGVCP